MKFTEQVLDEALKKGVREFCVCAGARNATLVYALAHCHSVKVYYWFEERSAAFFALGRSITTKRPVAVITTSGTASGELLPAAMESYYLGVPLLFITADRPRRFRGTGAPQSAEQVDLFKPYVEFCQDIAEGERCDLNRWSLRKSAHLNVCYEEPNDAELHSKMTISSLQAVPHLELPYSKQQHDEYKEFIGGVKYPFVIIGGAPKESRESLIRFLIDLNAPLYAEAISGIREDSRLSHLRVTAIDRAWRISEEGGYPIDGVLRIGGIPTARLWRDLETREQAIRVFSISEQPFSGLSWGKVTYTSIETFCRSALNIKSFKENAWKRWQASDHQYHHALQDCMAAEPTAEASLVKALSQKIPEYSRIYLGNSLPIREWDQAATHKDRYFQYGANRGLNGIDGQISTFLGWSNDKDNHWALIGDLTALYDMAAPWILREIPNHQVNIVIINNGGGQIFSRMFSHPAFCNLHNIDFAPLADLWKLPYHRLCEIPETMPDDRQQIIEIVPDNDATKRFLSLIGRM